MYGIDENQFLTCEQHVTHMSPALWADMEALLNEARNQFNDSTKVEVFRGLSKSIWDCSEFVEKKQHAFASIINMLKKGNTFFNALHHAIETLDNSFYQQQRHWNYIRGNLLSESERFGNTKLSQDVSASLRR